MMSQKTVITLYSIFYLESLFATAFMSYVLLHDDENSGVLRRVFLTGICVAMTWGIVAVIVGHRMMPVSTLIVSLSFNLFWLAGETKYRVYRVFTRDILRIERSSIIRFIKWKLGFLKIKK